jgi:hypothetical protein
MQFGGDLENAWNMFDHSRCVEGQPPWHAMFITLYIVNLDHHFSQRAIKIN